MPRFLAALALASGINAAVHAMVVMPAEFNQMVAA
jgi:hypothetical protein